MRRLARVVGVLAALAAAGPTWGSAADAPAKRAFTVADLYRLKGVEEPALSPDGRTIVYKVTTSDLKEMKRSSQLWLVDADGTQARALTHTDKVDSSPRFSPDG